MEKTNFTIDKSIEYIFEDWEKAIWWGRQHLVTTMLGAVMGSILVVAFWVILHYTSSMDMECIINDEVVESGMCQWMMSYLQYAMYALAFLSLGYAYLQYLVTYYVVTNKRIILKSWLIGADMRSVYYDQINSVFVNVGLVGSILGTGTVMIDTWRITQTDESTQTDHDKLKNISAPYEVYKYLQSELSDRKESLKSGRADFEFNKKEYKDFVQETEKFKKEV